MKYRNQFYLVVFAACALSILLGLGLVLVGFRLEGQEFMELSKRSGHYFTLSPRAVAGVFLILFSVGIGPNIVVFMLLLFSWLQKCSYYLSLFALKFSAIGISLCIIITAIYHINVNSKYFWYQGDIPKINTLNEFLSAMLIAAYSLLVVVSIWLTFRVLQPKPITPTESAELQPYSSICFNIGRILAGTLLLVTIFFLTLFLPNIWIITYMPLFHPNAYYVLDSPMSLIKGVIIFKGEITHYVPTSILNESLTYTSNDDNFKSKFNENNDVIIDPDWLQPVIYLKLYQDVVVYFTVVLVIIFIGTMGTYNSKLRRFLHRPVFLSFIPKVVNIWPLGASIGELLLSAVFIALNCYWFWYWSTGFTYRKATKLSEDKYAGLQLYARVMGQMATLSMSFLTFPIARNSVWESVFGVPFDRAIKYHLVLGELAWIFVTLHMVLWQIKWLLEGTLSHNCWQPTSLDDLIISGTKSRPIEFRTTNWTIPVMETIWLICTISLSISLFLRSKNYELFYYTHQLMILFFVFGFLHAFTFWYYTATGLGLYMFDKCLRLINASRLHNIVAMQSHSSQITNLTVRASALSTPHFAGQFAWICIPQISFFEWHPFTISSAPHELQGSEGTVSFTIKSRGPGTWTDRLANIALIEDVCDHNSIEISIDGPYGRTIPYSEYSMVILVAGGIGVTPMIAILSEICMRASCLQSIGNIRYIHFIWAIKDTDLLDYFRETLQRCHSTLKLIVTIKIFITGNISRSDIYMNDLEEIKNKDIPEEVTTTNNVLQSSTLEVFEDRLLTIALPTYSIYSGRPNISTIFRRLREEVEAEADTKGQNSIERFRDIVALVCGPMSLSELVSNEAFINGFYFQSEEFFF